MTVVEFYEIRHCHWCVHHRWLQPASRGCSLLSFAHSAILAKRYLPPCCSCTPISVRHPQLPSVTPGPWGGHGPFPLDGGSLCVHTITGFACIRSPPASLPSSLLARAGRQRHGISLMPRPRPSRVTTPIRFMYILYLLDWRAEAGRSEKSENEKAKGFSKA